MQTKNPTAVLAVRVPAELADTVREVAESRNLTVNEMLRADITAKYYCAPIERKTLKRDRSSDNSEIVVED